MIENKLILGADIGKDILQISCYQDHQEELLEITMPLEEKNGWTGQAVFKQLELFLKEQQLLDTRIEKIVLSFGEVELKVQKQIKNAFVSAGFSGDDLYVISRENAFIHYVIHQEKSLYEHTVLLFDFDGKDLYGYRLEHSKKKTPRKIKAEKSMIGSFTLLGESKDWGKMFDEHFASIARQILSKEVVSAVFLTGKGFEGGWLSKALQILCSGRRAFIGQNLFSGGCCYYGLDTKEQIKKDCVICAPETVLYEAGVVDGNEQFVTITKAGGAWYETKGSLVLIPERGGKLDIVFSNSVTMEKQVESVDISGLPTRPRKTGRLKVTVEFLGSREGFILVLDQGFGAFSPSTHQVFLKEFKLL